MLSQHTTMEQATSSAETYHDLSDNTNSDIII
jgi:hypothetical protein